NLGRETLDFDFVDHLVQNHCAGLDRRRDAGQFERNGDGDLVAFVHGVEIDVQRHLAHGLGLQILQQRDYAVESLVRAFELKQLRVACAGDVAAEVVVRDRDLNPGLALGVNNSGNESFLPKSSDLGRSTDGALFNV